MSATVPNYRWSASEFVRAWEAGAFDHRVELVEGEVWPVVIGDWRGEMVFHLASLLPKDGVRITGSTLPSEGSLPDPDCWVRQRDSQQHPGWASGSALGTQLTSTCPLRFPTTR